MRVEENECKRNNNKGKNAEQNEPTNQYNKQNVQSGGYFLEWCIHIPDFEKLKWTESETTAK